MEYWLFKIRNSLVSGVANTHRAHTESEKNFKIGEYLEKLHAKT